MKRCYGCFHEYEDRFSVCPDCGATDNIAPAEPIHLAPGTLLMDRYIIGLSVGEGGFGIVYKAWDTKLETIVAVKEFFVSRLVTRAAGTKDVIVSQKSYNEFSYRKERFLAEARTMAKFGDHRNIPNVFEFFEENNTAYIVMELLDGIALNDYMKQHGNTISPDFAVMIAGEVSNALKSLHEEKIIHRDVAPDNIFICSGKDIKIKLMDLGAAKLADATDDVIDIILKPGYSPPEQYDNSKNIGPWTDIYALGATLYSMLTSVKPDESTNRKIEDKVVPPSQLVKGISENLDNTVMKAMAVDRHMRFKNVSEFMKAVNGEKKVIPLSKEKMLRSLRRAAGIAAAFLLVGASVYAGLNILDRKVDEQKLAPAELSIWYSADEGSDEIDAMETVKEDFESVYPDVKLELTPIPAADYDDRIKEASEKGTLPDLFESTDIDENELESCLSLDNIVSSEQYKKCLFLDQGQFDKKIPLGIEVPVAFVITNGAECTEFEGETFSALSDLNYANIAVDERKKELVEANFPTENFKAGSSDFLDPVSNTSAVMLSSSMMINEFRSTLTNYERCIAGPDTDTINCGYTYYWSIGASEEDDVRASERLLSWMLGNVYQNTLMISRCSDGQIPVNKESFQSKTESKLLRPLKELYSKFSFDRENTD